MTKVSARCALLALFIPTAMALAACGHSGGKPSGGSPASGGSSGNCAAGYTSGQIAGQQKCLQNGQQCQQEHASDYKKYGFTCTKNNGRYELKKS